MLKCLAILAMIFAFTQAPSDAPRQGGNQQNHAAHDANKGNATSPPITQPSRQTGVIAEKPDGKPKSERTQQKPNYWEEAFEPTNLPNWALVNVGGFAGFLAWRTLNGIRKQADLMETQAGHMEKQTQILADSVKVAQQSADSTKLQIEIFINAERAKITIAISEMGRSFKIYGKNTGRGIAAITSCRGTFKVLPFKESLPETPEYFVPSGWDYTEQINRDEKFDIMDGEGEYGLMADLSEEKLCVSIRAKLSTLWIFGRICYGDGISSNPRETRFCYKTFLLENGDISICAGGPAAYRLET